MMVYAQAYPELATELRRSVRGELPPGWDADMPVFPADPKGLATRVASGKVMNAVAPRVPTLVGGSADLRSVYPHGAERPWRFQSAGEPRHRYARIERRRLELRRTQPAPRRPRARLLPPSVGARLAVELGVRQGWERYTGGQGDMLGVERFGASAPGEVLLRDYGCTVDNICARAKALLRG